MQFDAQDTEYRRANPDGSFDVIEVDGRPAGRLYVDRRPGDLRIVDIALLPEFRGRGIGEAADRRAAAGGGRVGPHREHPRRGPQPRGPALRAARLRAVAEDLGVYRRMEWTP